MTPAGQKKFQQCNKPRADEAGTEDDLVAVKELEPDTPLELLGRPGVTLPELVGVAVFETGVLDLSYCNNTNITGIISKKAQQHLYLN